MAPEADKAGRTGGMRDIVTPSFAVLCLSNFLSWLSYYTVSPVLTNYMRYLGAGMTAAGIAGGLFAFTSVFMRPLSGMMCDRFDRKRLLILSTCLMALMQLMYALIPSPAAVLFFRGMQGLAFAVNATSSTLMVDDLVPRKRVGEALGYFGLMFVFATLIGPNLGIWISSGSGYRTVLFVSAGMLALSAAAAYLIPARPAGLVSALDAERRSAQTADGQQPDLQGKGFLHSVFEKRVIDMALMFFCFTIIGGATDSFIVPFCQENGIPGSGLFFTVFSVSLIIIRFALGSRLDKWVARTIMVPAFIAGIGCLILISSAHSLLPILIAACLKAYQQATAQPALQAESIRAVPENRKGAALGTISAGGDCGQAIGSMAAGAIAGAAGYRGMFLISAVPLVIALLWFMLFSKYRSGKRIYG
ncbi:MAG: MFS transporter [Lachnospiraceae bacterium]|nr:MFS transporter [Lachnospiraceae bacterium]